MSNRVSGLAECPLLKGLTEKQEIEKCQECSYDDCIHAGKNGVRGSKKRHRNDEVKKFAALGETTSSLAVKFQVTKETIRRILKEK